MVIVEPPLIVAAGAGAAARAVSARARKSVLLSSGTSRLKQGAGTGSSGATVARPTARLEDPHRRADRQQAPQPRHVAVVEPDAAVRRAAGDPLRLVGPVDADDPAAGPVAEHGIGPGAEGVRPVDGAAAEAAQ